MTTQNQVYTIFVYGSLRQGFQHPAYEYMSRYFRLIGAARVQGILYDLGDFPAAKPATGDQYIIGELYEVLKAEEFPWVMAQIDDYEGLHVEPGEQPLYYRAVTPVLLDDHSHVDAWIYWYNGDVSGKQIVASGDVLDYIQQKQKGG
jgi:gamma-glutamylcyclotransferase (GGCT)/AIG2-like uncharacterized protein YtfP